MSEEPEMTDIHRTELRVRYAECDPMGVVHHSRYLMYMEIARTEHLRARGLVYKDMEEAGVFIVVASMSLKFRAPGRYDDVILIETTLERVTAGRIDHAYRISRKTDGTLLAEGTTTLACVDRDGTLIRVPQCLRETALADNADRSTLD